MTAFAPPVATTYDETDPAAPLVVLLHGRGSAWLEMYPREPHAQLSERVLAQVAGS